MSSGCPQAHHSLLAPDHCPGGQAPLTKFSAPATWFTGHIPGLLLVSSHISGLWLANRVIYRISYATHNTKDTPVAPAWCTFFCNKCFVALTYQKSCINMKVVTSLYQYLASYTLYKYAHLFPHINTEQRFQSIIHWSPVLQGAMFTSCWHNINWSRNFRHEKHGARARGWAGDDVTLPALMSRVWGEQRAAGPHLSDYDRVAWLWYPASVGAGKHDVGDRGMVSEINWRFT